MASRSYLDHHATTPLSDRALAAMRPLLEEGFVGNSSSSHHHGRRARALIEDARRSVARVIGASASALTFTSGGTEALHLSVLGLGRRGPVSSLWCDPGAHPCVVAAMEALGVERSLPLRWIPTRAEGAMDVEALSAALEPDALLALSWVQHETGAVLDLPPLRSLLAERGARWALDGVQALGKVAVEVAATGADAVAFSAHKIGGPQGVGALWVRAGASLATVMPGGGQERGLRGGTENLLGIVGFGAAASGVADRLAAMPPVAARRDAIERALTAHGASPSVALRPRVATVSHVGWAAEVSRARAGGGLRRGGRLGVVGVGVLERPGEGVGLHREAVPRGALAGLVGAEGLALAGDYRRGGRSFLRGRGEGAAPLFSGVMTGSSTA
jgi:cysteine desulfurase